MNGPRHGLVLLTLVLGSTSPLAAETPAPAGKARVEFVRDIQPLLQARCLKCHGPEKRRGGLLLTARESALLPGDSGLRAIVPGHADKSELLARITSDDPTERMPPGKEPLTPAEVRLLRDWIAQGAVWPSEGNAERHWAYVKPKAHTVPDLRDRSWAKNAIDHFIRARLEREGLESSPEADRARLLRRVYLDLVGLPPAVEEVDTFLADASPDAYEKVVDRLLASPHYGERWARPWLDLARYADSNGFQRDGFRTVWPYRDWVIQALNDDLPFDAFTRGQLAGDLLPGSTLADKIATGFNRCTTVNVEAGVDREEDRVLAVVDRVNTMATVWLGTTLACAQCHNHKYDPFTQQEYYRLFAYFNNTPIETQETTGVAREFIGPKVTLPLDPEEQLRVRQLTQSKARLARSLKERTAKAAPGLAAWEKETLADAKAKKKLPANVRRALNVAAGKRTKQQQQVIRQHFLGLDPEIRVLQTETKAIDKELAALQPATSLVMTEREQPRKTHVLKRGDFLTPGEEVAPGTPSALHTLPSALPANRLGLAEWVTHPDNPLTARVTVNRWWAAFFGRGIVTTLEDFGTRGARPTHPALLDWLATEFVRRGWSRKAIHRLIVTSATYRQSARLTPALRARDPDNALYARGPRFRLNAERIRDQALAVSGLLSTRMAGPPVFPPQPAGIWRVIGKVDNTYRTSQGAEANRRGLYTIWRRSSPYPSFVAFDAPDRSACVIQRSRTNTPLQALTLLNDPVFVDVARAFALRIARHEASTPREKIVRAFRTCLTRSPRNIEVEILERVYRESVDRYRDDLAGARVLLGVKAVAGQDLADLAGWFQVAAVLLNLDETITKG